jgi:hypothetical protein
VCCSYMCFAFGNEFEGVPAGVEDNFKEVALDALDAVEAPCQVIFTRERTLPPPPPPCQPESWPIIAKSIPKRKLLYLQLPNTDSSSSPILLKLACPMCSRTDFSALQGLLNHARLSHKLEFLSHDECIAQCAIPFSDEEKEEWEKIDHINARGTEVTVDGGVPSLKRLFHLAVGNFDLHTTIHRKTGIQGGGQYSGTLLARTLGYHLDTPALAPFLGRTPKRRCINVYGDENDEIDIISLSEPEGRQEKDRWRMAYTHRSKARPELDVIMESPSAVDQNSFIEPSTNVPKHVLPDDISRSRFHIVARVVVTDRSLFIHPGLCRMTHNLYLRANQRHYCILDRRTSEKESHTHHWSITVTSPSYVSQSPSVFITKY